MPLRCRSDAAPVPLRCGSVERFQLRNAGGDADDAQVRDGRARAERAVERAMEGGFASRLAVDASVAALVVKAANFFPQAWIKLGTRVQVAVSVKAAGKAIADGTGGDQPRVDEGLVNTTDLFATILEVAGLDLAREIPAVLPSVPVAGDGRGEPLWVDSLSLLSALRPHASAPGGGRREYAYAELFKRGPPDPRFPMSKAIRDRAGYKLIRFTDPGPGLGREELYYLPDDPLEQRNLLGLDLTEELATRHAELRERLDGIARSGWRATGAPLPPIGPRSAGAHGS